MKKERKSLSQALPLYGQILTHLMIACFKLAEMYYSLVTGFFLIEGGIKETFMGVLIHN